MDDRTLAGFMLAILDRAEVPAKVAPLVLAARERFSAVARGEVVLVPANEQVGNDGNDD